MITYNKWWLNVSSFSNKLIISANEYWKVDTFY